MILIWFLLAQAPPDDSPELPPLADTRRFPSKEECDRAKSGMEGHLEWLEHAELAWPELREEFAAWKRQTRHAVFLWDVLGEAQQTWLDERTARERLDRYRYWVGDDNYAAGWVPPRVPVEKLGFMPRVRE